MILCYFSFQLVTYDGICDVSVAVVRDGYKGLVHVVAGCIRRRRCGRPGDLISKREFVKYALCIASRSLV